MRRRRGVLELEAPPDIRSLSLEALGERVRLAAEAPTAIGLLWLYANRDEGRTSGERRGWSW
jgi:hypothetical protein